jgi:hypothetical protein
VLMNDRPPLDDPAAGAHSGTTSPTTTRRPGRHLIAAMLLAAAAMDLARCGVVMVAARHPAPAAGLVAVGLAAAALSVRTARGCRAGQPWAGWAALLIGATSAPQAAASGFHAPYTIPDTATAVLGVLLAVAVLATAGRTGQPGSFAYGSCVVCGYHPVNRSAATHAPADHAHGAIADAGPLSGLIEAEAAPVRRPAVRSP